MSDSNCNFPPPLGTWCSCWGHLLESSSSTAHMEVRTHDMWRSSASSQDPGRIIQGCVPTYSDSSCHVPVLLPPSRLSCDKWDKRPGHRVLVYPVGWFKPMGRVRRDWELGLCGGQNTLPLGGEGQLCNAKTDRWAEGCPRLLPPLLSPQQLLLSRRHRPVGAPSAGSY